MYEYDGIDFNQMGDTSVETLETEQATTAIYEDILAIVKSAVDFNSASLLLLSKKKKLQTVAQFGEGCNFINSMRFKMGNGLSAWLAQRKRTICLSDIHRGARHGHNPIRSFVAAPILFQENVIGILNLAHILPNAFGPEEVETIEELLTSIAPRINSLMSNES
ncbi:GAF domain-containing protein [candidate division KSB1 bacterium]|nr:GAF domain-containing protein [candidate division KSB1 bacterium]